MRLKPLKIWQIFVIIISIIVLAIGGSILGVYLSGGFEPKKTPPDDINIEDLDEKYNTLTGQYEIVDEFHIKITSPTEQINQKTIKFGFESGISVTRYPDGGLDEGEITDGIIIIKEYAKLGQEVYIKPRQKDYSENGKTVATNAGGISRLVIETENKVLPTTTISIAVDVPVESIDLLIFDDSSSIGSNKPLDGSVAENSMFRIEPRFFPASSKYLFSSNSEDRVKKVYYQSLANSENIEVVSTGDDVRFVAGDHVSENNKINGYVFKKGTDQEAFGGSYDEALAELHRLANDDTAEEKRAICQPIEVDVIEATIGYFNVMKTSEKPLSLTTNKLYTLYAGTQERTSDSEGLRIDIQDKATTPHAEMIKNVGLRLTEVYAKSDTGRTQNLLNGDYFGESGHVRIKGGTKRTAISYSATGEPQSTEYLLINSDVRINSDVSKQHYDYSYWEFAVDGEYTFVAQVVLIWQDKDSTYKLYTDETTQEVVSYNVYFDVSDGEPDKDIEWNTNAQELSVTVVYSGSTLQPSQLDLTNIYKRPETNVYKRLVFFVYLEDLPIDQIKNYVNNLDDVGKGDYSSQISGVSELYPVQQGSELIVTNPGRFKLLFATVKTNAYNEPLMRPDGTYEIVKYVAPKDVVVNKSLRQPDEMKFSIDEKWLKGSLFVIPASTPNAITLTMKLQTGDREIFDAEYNAQRIKFYASEDSEGLNLNDNIFSFEVQPGGDDVTIHVSVKNVEIAIRNGQSFYIFMAYDNTKQTQLFAFNPDTMEYQQQIMIYQQTPMVTKTKDASLENQTYRVDQQLTTSGSSTKIQKVGGEGTITLDTFNQCLKSNNIVILDQHNREMVGAEYAIISSNESIVGVNNNEKSLTFNSTEQESQVTVNVRAIGSDSTSSYITFILVVKATGVTKIEVDGKASDNLNNVKVELQGKQNTTYSPKEKLQVYVSDGEYPKTNYDVYLSSAFIQSVQGLNDQSQAVWDMLKFNDNAAGETFDTATKIDKITLVNDFGRSLEIPCVVRNADSTVNFAFTITITPVLSDGTNTLNSVDYGFGNAGVLDEDKTATDVDASVYAGFKIDLDQYLKVREGQVEDPNQHHWSNLNGEVYDLSSSSAEVIGRIENGVLTFNDVYRTRRVEIVLYSLMLSTNGTAGNQFAYFKRLTLNICPNIDIEVNKTAGGDIAKDFSMADLAQNEQNGTQLDFTSYVDIVRKTKTAEKTKEVDKSLYAGFKVGTESERNNYILINKNENDVFVASFNSEGQHALELGYGETSKTSPVWLLDNEGEVIDSATCSLKFVVGISHTDLMQEGANSWFSNFVRYGGQRMLLIPNNEITYVAQTIDALKAEITGGSYQITSENEGIKVRFNLDGNNGIIIGETRSLNLNFNGNGHMYASIKVPLIISLVGNSFALYTTENDNDYFYGSEENIDFAQLINPSLVGNNAFRAQLQGGATYWFFSPEQVLDQNYSFEENGVLKIGSSTGEVTLRAAENSAVSGTISVDDIQHTYTAIYRTFGWRLTSFDGVKYLSGLLKSDVNDNSGLSARFSTPSQYENAYTIDNDGKLVLSDVVGENDLNAEFNFIVSSDGGAHTYTFVYRIVITSNAELRAPNYPYNGNFEVVEVDSTAPKTINLSDPLGTPLHPTDKRFPDEIKRNGGDWTPIDLDAHPATVAVTSIKIGNEEVGVNNNRFNVYCNLDTITFSNPSMATDVTVTIQKTYKGIYGGILTYTFRINPSTNFVYYVLFTETNNGGILSERVGDKQTLTLSRGQTGVVNTVTMQRDANEPNLNSPITTAITTFSYDPTYITVTGDGSSDSQVINKLTIKPKEFVPYDMTVSIIFAVADTTQQTNATQLDVFVPATVEVNVTTSDLYGNGTFTLGQTNLAQITTSGYEFESLVVNSVEIDGVTYENPDDANSEFVKDDGNMATQKFWEVKDNAIEFYHTIKDYYITLTLNYKDTATSSNKGYVTQRFKVDKSLTINNTTTINLNNNAELVYTDDNNNKIIFGGIQTAVSYDKLLHVDHGTGIPSTPNFTMSSTSSDISEVTYGYDSSLQGTYLKFKPREVAELTPINFYIDIQYANGNYKFGATVPFTATISPNAEITPNYPTISGGDYESIAGDGTAKNRFWSSKDTFAEAARLTGYYYSGYGTKNTEGKYTNPTKNNTIAFEDVKIGVAETENVLLDTSNIGSLTETQEKTKLDEAKSFTMNGLEDLAIKLYSAAVSGSVTFDVTYHGAHTTFVLHVVKQLISSRVNMSIHAEAGEGDISAQETIYSDVVNEDGVFDLDRLIEIGVASAAPYNTVATIFVVNDDEATKTAWKEQELTSFTIENKYIGTHIFVDWGGNDATTTKTRVNNAFDNSGKAHIEFRNSEGTIIGGLTAIRLAGRVEFVYATQDEPVVITEDKITYYKDKEFSNDKTEEVTITVGYKETSIGQPKQQLKYKFIRAADIDVLNKFDNNNPNFVNIVTNYMYRPQGPAAYSFIERAGVIKASTGEKLDLSKGNIGNVTISLRVVNVDPNNSNVNDPDYRYKDYATGQKGADGTTKLFKYRTNPGNLEYLTFDEITFGEDENKKVYDFVVFGEGCANDGDYVLTEFTYTVREVPHSFQVAFHLVPGYQVTINGSQLVHAEIDKSTPDTNEATGVTSNIGNIYSFRPRESGGNKLTIAASTGEHVLSVTRPLWSGVELAQSFKVTLTEEDESGTYNKTETMNKLGFPSNGTLSDWTKSTTNGTVHTLSNTDLVGRKVEFNTIKVQFGEKLYKLRFIDNYNYIIDFYFKLLPFEDQNPTVSGLSSSAYIEGEKFDVGSIFTRLVTESKDGKTTYTAETNQPPAPEESLVKKFVVDGIKAYGFTSNVSSTDDVTDLASEYTKPPILNNVTISEIWFNYVGQYGSARVKVNTNTNIPVLDQLGNLGGTSEGNRLKRSEGKRQIYENTSFTISKLESDIGGANQKIVLTTTIDIVTERKEDESKTVTYEGETENYIKKKLKVILNENYEITQVKFNGSDLFKSDDSVSPLAEGTTYEFKNEANSVSSFTYTRNNGVISLAFSIEASKTNNAGGSLTLYFDKNTSTTAVLGTVNTNYLATDDLYYPNVDEIKFRPITEKYTVPTMPGWIYGDSDTVSASVQIVLKYEDSDGTEVAALDPYPIQLSKSTKIKSKANVVIDATSFNLNDYMEVENGSALFYDDTLAVTVPGNSAVVTVTVTLDDSTRMKNDGSNESTILEGAIVEKTNDKDITLQESNSPNNWKTENKQTTIQRQTSTITQTYYAGGYYNMSLSDMQGRAISPSTQITVKVESSVEGAMISYGGVWFKVDREGQEDKMYRLGAGSTMIDAITQSTSRPGSMDSYSLTGYELSFKPKAITKDILYIEDAGVVNTNELSRTITKSYVVKTNRTYYKHVQTYKLTRWWSYFNDGLGVDNILRINTGYDSKSGTDNGYTVPLSVWGQKAMVYKANAGAVNVEQNTTGNTITNIFSGAIDTDNERSIRFVIGDESNTPASFDDTSWTLDTGTGYKLSNEQYILIRVYVRASGGPFGTKFSQNSQYDFDFVQAGKFRIILEE